jgi:TRAP-type C4-dicarboxylate transport system permease small subunit
MLGVFKAIRVALCRLLEAALIVAVLVLVLDVLWGVFTRKVLGDQAQWSEELARFLLIWISLLGGAVAFGERAHLGVDYFVGKLAPEAKRFMAVVVQIIVLVFAVTIFLLGGTRVVLDTLAVGQSTPALGIEKGHVYLALPIAGVFITLFAIEQLVEVLLDPNFGKEDR